MTYHNDDNETVPPLSEKGWGLFDRIVQMLNEDHLEMDEIANILEMDELHVKIVLIIGMAYDG